MAAKDIPTSKVSLQHLPELNSLRALAVVMTLLAHFSPFALAAFSYKYIETPF